MKRSLIYFIIILCGAVFLFATSYNWKNQVPSDIEFKNTENSETTNDSVERKRNVIESEYPELRDFEYQESFAGKSVKTHVDGDSHYFVYIVHGSGLPIVQGTCFQVDQDLKVVKVGEFSNQTDSITGYSDIDPKTCEGF